MSPECLYCTYTDDLSVSLMRSECLLTISEPTLSLVDYSWTEQWVLEDVDMLVEVRFNTDQAPNICWAPWQVGHL